MIHYLLIGCVVFYWSSIIYLIVGFKSKKKPKPIPSTSICKQVSILIPFRNEEQNLPDLLRSIKNLNLERIESEVLFINDHSEDKGVKLVETFLEENHLRCNLIHLDSTTGKKSALAAGISRSKFPIILTTDADCILQPNWIKDTLSVFDSEVDMVVGSVNYNSSGTIMEDLQLFELLGILAVNFCLKTPFLSNGANMAFRKSIFHRIKGYSGNEHIATGDDVFLLNKVLAIGGKVIGFIDTSSSPNTIIPKNLKEIINQKLRWASKWRHGSITQKIIALTVFLFYLTYWMTSLLTFPEYSEIVIFCFLIKSLLDFWFLHTVFPKSRLNLFRFLISEFIYPFYVIFFAIASNFGSYSWKGRKH